MSNFIGDLPIEKLDQDKLGHSTLASSVAKCIMSIQKPNGGVIAISGPWGSGKSSMVNLIRHEIKKQESHPIIISFDSWCYRSEDGIINGFFQEFYSGLKSEIGSNKINLVPLKKLAARASGVSSLIEIGLDSLALPGFGAAVSKVKTAAASTYNVAKDIIGEPEGIEELRIQVCDMLEKIDNSILIVVDDIDRLSPEEAMSVFRLIKSIGRLTNVTYLIAHDRKVSEKMITKYYPYEGRQYLEKVVQANFDLPEPSTSDILSMLDERFNDIFGDVMFDHSMRIYKTVINTVIPEIKTPRDVHRLANILSVTYPAVEGKVDIADFIAIETFRLFQPKLHKLIYHRRQSNSGVTGYPVSTPLFDSGTRDFRIAPDKEVEENMLTGVKLKYKKSLVRLFPGIDGRVSNSREYNVQRWNQEKRVCSDLHFDTYFSFSAYGEVVSDEEYQEFCRLAGDEVAVKYALTNYLNVKDKSGRTKTSYLLDKLAYGSHSIDNRDLKAFLIALYEEANTIRVASDSIRRFGRNLDTSDRIIELTKRILGNRKNEFEVFSTLKSIYESAPIDLLIRLAYFVHKNHDFKRQDDIVDVNNIDEEKIMMAKEDIDFLNEVVHSRICSAIEDGTAFEHNNMAVFLGSISVTLVDSEKFLELIKNTLKDSKQGVIESARKSNNLFMCDIGDNDLNIARSRWINQLDDDSEFESKLVAILKRTNLSEEDRIAANQLTNLLTAEYIKYEIA